MGRALIYSLEGARRERFKTVPYPDRRNDADVRFSTICWGSSCCSRRGTFHSEKIICESN